MKKFLFIAIISISSSAFAQDSTRAVNLKAMGIKTYDQAWAKMDQVLKLTPQETTAWQSLNQSYAPQYKAIATNSSLSSDEKQTQMATLHNQQEAALKKVITPAQYAEWTGIKKQVIATAQTKTASMASSTTTRTTRTTVAPVRKQ